MKQFEIKNLSFSYAQNQNEVLSDLSFSVNKGEFFVICGPSGCGKTTLMKLLKPELSPKGKKTGQVLFENQEVSELSLKTTASQIGFVSQDTDYQIVTHTAMSELSFGLENLGFDSNTIALRLAEITAYFSMSSWLNKNVNELSGGQRQLLSLASVLILYPKVLILDEPTSQLDPMASEIFIDTLRKINAELGITIIITEHRLENILPISSSILVLNKGKKIYNDKVEQIFSSNQNLDFFKPSLPTPMRIYSEFGSKSACPITISEGKNWLETLLPPENIKYNSLEKDKSKSESNPIIKLKNLYFKYPNTNKLVVNGASLAINENTIHAILGSNAVGKTTLLKLITGILKTKTGKIKIYNKNIHSYKQNELYSDLISVMPQKVQTMFSCETVLEQMQHQLSDKKLSTQQKQTKIDEIAKLLGITDIYNHHPYDISGGQMQKLGLALVLLQNPKIIFLDEPTKGMDAEFKIELAKIFLSLKQQGVSIVLISHDTEFCASYCDECSLMFEGKIVASGNRQEFFSNNFFFTTAAKKLSRELFDNTITCEEVISLCKKNL